MKERLGIDIGGVISVAGNDGRENDEYLKTPPVEGAVEVITALNENRFWGEIYLVSKCGFAMQHRTKRWLAAQNFYERTGVAPDHAWFCLRRVEKADIAKVLGLTHFIDDRLEILNYLAGIVPNRVLFRPKQREVETYQDKALPPVTRVESWDEVRRLWLP